MLICLNVDPAIHVCVATQTHKGSWIILVTGSVTYEGIFWLSYFLLLVMGMCDWVQNSPNRGLTAVRPICHKMTSLWAVGLHCVLVFLICSRLMLLRVHVPVLSPELPLSTPSTCLHPCCPASNCCCSSI